MEDVLAALGVTLIDVPGMRHEGCWVGAERIALVRAGLPVAVRDDVLDQMVQRALSLE